MTTSYEWTGKVGDVWAAEWRGTDLSFTGLTSHLNAAILAAAPDRGDAVDIGCGAGGTSIALAKARPNLAVTGIDVSDMLVATARGRGEGIANLRFETRDARALADGVADLLFSRHGVMFFDDPVAGFAALRRATRPGAAFVFSCFGAYERNPWARETAAAVTGIDPAAPDETPGPFAFADSDRVHRILSASGWRGEAQAVDYSYFAGQGTSAVEDALAFLSRIGPAAARLRELDSAAREAGLVRLRNLLESRYHDEVVDFPAAAWIWSCRPA